MPRVIQGFSVGQFTPEHVLRAHGLDARATVDDLVRAAAAHDATNPGYLSQAELELGATDLNTALVGSSTTAPTTGATSGMRYARKSLADVKDEYLSGVPGRTFSDDEVLGAAALWDDGNGYLKKKELEAGAMELQMTTASGQPLRASDLAAIRSWTGSTRSGVTPVSTTGSPELGIVSDIDKTLMPPARAGDPEPTAYPGAGALLTLLEIGADGTGALGDVRYVTARNPSRVTTLDAWFAANGLPAGVIETGTSSVPWIAEEEKVADIERLFLARPDQSFLLLGDTNHRDPEVYRRIRDKYPTQVKAVLLHDVKTIDPARTDGHLLVKSYAEAAAVLFRLGVIDEIGARSVIEVAVADGVALTSADIDALIDAHRP